MIAEKSLLFDVPILSLLSFENTVQRGDQLLKRGYSEAIVKVCFFGTFLSTLTRGRRKAGLRALGEAACEVIYLELPHHM